MSVDFFDCVVCGESVCECGDFESCECGRKWCSLECAVTDGFKEESCDKGYDKSDSDNDCESELSCWECEHEQVRSCKFCREEDFEDGELLQFCLNFLHKTRESLIADYKLSK